MKKLSIKTRVTLWYSMLMLLLVVLVLGFMMFVSETIADSGARNTLIQVVDGNMNEVEYDDGALDIDDDFAYFKSGVTSVIYSSDNALLGGYLPGGFQTDEPLTDGALRTVISDGQSYSIYDRLITSKKHGDIWVRGIIPADGTGGVLSMVMKAAFILLPFIVLIAALVGYQIAKRSFMPIEKITDAANAIGEGGDLSKRIALGDGQDEIHKLADTFDRMFSRLESSFEEEKQFTSDVSHELRTPISVILSQCEYALEHDSAEADYRESLKTVQRQATRMSRLISQLLTFTRLEQGQEKAVFENTDLSELVGIICEEQADIGSEDISLSADIAPNILATVDRSLIARLLSNLIGNAYQYGKEGGWIKVRLHQENHQIRLNVQDNGIGIPAKHLEKIWHRFHQADPSRTANESGSMGLGLSMVKQITKIHGGDIQVESVLGEGSTFTFSFPSGKEMS